nr:AAA family ATPase [Rhodoferax sp.]
MFKPKNQQQKLDPAFEELCFYRFNPDDLTVDSVELVVPATKAMKELARTSMDVADDDIRQARAAQAEKIARERAKKEVVTEDEDAPKDDESRSGFLTNKSLTSAASKKQALTLTVLDSDEERVKLKALYEAGIGLDEVECEDDQPKNVEVYAWDEPLKLINSLRIFDKDINARNQKIYEALRTKGNRRILARPRDDRIDQVMSKLRYQHPNFGEVIDLVRKQFLMAVRSGKPLAIPPILLLGPPGVGKTHFCSTLAQGIGSVVHKISFDSAITSSVLLGSDKHWGNSTTGGLFEAVAMSSFANPVFLLDEIDKPRSHYQSPLASLHSVLEPVSNKTVTDISIGFEFSVQHVIFIGAGNDPLAIPSTIRSRFTEFRIEAPTSQDALTMADVMVRSSHATLNNPDFCMPGRDISRLVAHLTPREQRKAMEAAYASAIADGRDRLSRDDLPADVLADDESLKRRKSGQWIH